MKKCIFIVPYFGRMPNYFQLFLKSCEYNKSYEWIIFTDDDSEYDYPINVKKIDFTFKQLQELIQKKFDFLVSIDKPYKLCDFKPAYGYIFEEYIKEYKFWGHCDIDTLMGDLNKFITEDILVQYDKIFCLGHMILYKNNYENNRVFMLPTQGRYLYKESFSSPNITVFDETFGNNENVDYIFLEYGKKVLREDWSINFSILPARFTRTKFDGNTNKFIMEKYKKAIYLWDNGKIYRLFIKNNEIIKEEYMYMHLQARKMKVKGEVEKTDIFKIVPNSFLPLEVEEITDSNFYAVKKKDFNLHFIKTQYKWKLNKVKRIINNLLK